MSSLFIFGYLEKTIHRNEAGFIKPQISRATRHLTEQSATDEQITIREISSKAVQ